ncbi:MAG: M48 family metalloprotease [Planctomycetota bacterium]|nr:M48 family metalloprotease [Planctomycetota bacterium]
MVYVLVIVSFLAIYLHDLAGGSGVDLLGLSESNGDGSLADAGVATVLPLVALAALVHLACWKLAGRVDQGSVRAIRVSDRLVAVSRACALGWHVLAVLGLGWPALVRSWTGDIVAIDELVMMTPFLLFVVAGWSACYPIERRVNEAVLFRELEESGAVVPPVGRWAFVVSRVRHQLLLALVPLLAVTSWSEALDRGVRMMERAIERRADLGVLSGLHELRDPEGVVVMAAGVVQIVGVIAIVVVMPLLLRFVWDATPLGPGALRDRLMLTCQRHGVRVAELLVWRTHGTLVNGAVLGIVWPFRYMLLTDRLLETMSWRHVEAVAAHEVAHVRRWHIPWLGVVTLATLSSSALLTEVIFAALQLSEESRTAIGVGSIAFTALAVLGVFGFVSRRFEWQADAFAAIHMSGASRVGGSEPTQADGARADTDFSPGAVLGGSFSDPVRSMPTVTIEGVRAMAGALQAVADLNGLPVERSSFRHGSIATRQQKLMELAGSPAHALPIDRQVRAIKCAAAIVLGAMLVVGGAGVVV